MLQLPILGVSVTCLRLLLSAPNLALNPLISIMSFAYSSTIAFSIEKSSPSDEQRYFVSNPAVMNLNEPVTYSTNNKKCYIADNSLSLVFFMLL